MQSDRLVTLDGLRGIAAVAVVLHHVLRYVPSPLFGPGYLAVDFFFVLSGLVLARTYETRFAKGLSPVEYFGRRLLRLYPAILAGLALGLAVTLWQHAEPAIWIVAAAQAVMIPQLQGMAFPLNVVQWSLFFELFANALHAVIHRWLSNWMLAGIIVIAGAALWGLALSKQWLPGGPKLESYDLGFARVMFSFFAGVALHRLGASGRLARLPRLPFPAAALVLVAILALPLRRFIDPVISDLVVVTFVWPALVAVTMKDAKSTSWRSLADWSGRLSYPIYAIHFPIIAAFAPLVGNQDASVVERYVYAAVALAVSVAAALLVERYIERPVLTRQKRLTKQTPASST